MLLTGTDHTRCPRAAHRTTADAARGESAAEGPAALMVCGHCGAPLVHCSEVAAANADGAVYERAYFHPNHRDEESCR